MRVEGYVNLSLEKSVVGFWKPTPLSFLSRMKGITENDEGKGTGRSDCMVNKIRHPCHVLK